MPGGRGYGRQRWARVLLGVAAATGVRSASAQPPPASAREAQLEERVRQLETMVQQLSGQVQRLSAASAASGAAAGGAPNPGPGDLGSAASSVTPSAIGGPSAPGQSLPPNPAPSARFDAPATLEDRPGAVKFGPGFEIKSGDDEFIFQFHNLTQFDYRGYLPGGQATVHDTFAFPRQWFMFSGRITRPWGYFVSLQNGIDTVSLLDAFIDANFDPRLQFRVGRYKTPFTYEFLVEPIQGLITPERSLFFNNFGLNRDNGVMAWGRLLGGRIDYATAIQNGARNAYLANVSTPTVVSFLNVKPWGAAPNTLLENFNLGGSIYAGPTNNVPIPAVFRTAIATSGNQTIGEPFLALDSNVRDRGLRAFWDLHTAWYYRSLALLGEWGSGFQNYALSSSLQSQTRVPVQSFYVQAGYLLTGETRSSTGIVKPLRPFDLTPGHFGLGALELTARYNFLDIGSEVFTHGLADPNNWANRVSMTDIGFNWHLTQYLKFYFDWQHAMYNQPVLFAPGRRALTNDLFLARFQLFF